MKVAECFPDVQVQNRVKKNLRIMADYDWVLPKERKNALKHVGGMYDALELGLWRQAQLQYSGAEDRMFFDYSNKVVRIAKKEGLKMNPLAKLDEAPIEGFKIKGSGIDWEFKPIEEYERMIPADILRKTNLIRKLGLRWHMSFIGEPVPPPRRARVPVKDPILAISIGRWILEVGRWD